jgi:hypothetical protein
MVNRKAISWKAKGASLETAHRPLSRVNGYLQSDGDENVMVTRRELWAAGFVTSEGTHIRLFVRLRPRR